MPGAVTIPPDCGLSCISTSFSKIDVQASCTIGFSCIARFLGESSRKDPVNRRAKFYLRFPLPVYIWSADSELEPACEAPKSETCVQPDKSKYSNVVWNGLEETPSTVQVTRRGRMETDTTRVEFAMKSE